MPRIVLLADFPVNYLPGREACISGHHATWLPPLAKELEAYTSEFDFHWIICSKETYIPTEIRAWGQTFHLIPRTKLSLQILTAFRKERRQIFRLISTLKPDLIHAWGTEQGYALAATDSEYPTIISMQGLLQICCATVPMPILTRIQARNERLALRRATHLTVESSWGKSQLQSLAPHATIDLLEYGVDPTCFDIERIPAEKPLAVFVGTLSLLKGVDTLLAAFTAPRLSGIQLVILGNGNFRIAKHRLPANIRVLGHRPPAEVRAWMAKAWCLVHPTRADTSPNCVKEARVIGLPVITTPNGGQTQYVIHGQSGFIHPADDVEGIIQGVLAATADRETSLHIGATDNEKCRKLLTPVATAKRLIAIYQKVGYLSR